MRKIWNNYRVSFFLGIILFLAGIILLFANPGLSGFIFIVLGILFLLLGRYDKKAD